jgi:hypothetical protein
MKTESSSTEESEDDSSESSSSSRSFLLLWGPFPLNSGPITGIVFRIANATGEHVTKEVAQSKHFQDYAQDWMTKKDKDNAQE